MADEAGRWPSAWLDVEIGSVRAVRMLRNGVHRAVRKACTAARRIERAKTPEKIGYQGEDEITSVCSDIRSIPKEHVTGVICTPSRMSGYLSVE